MDKKILENVRYAKIKNLLVNIDLTTACNAACPLCERTNPELLETIEHLPSIQWYFDDFKKAFPPHILKEMAGFSFCGSWGDAIMCKDIYEIVEYICEHCPGEINISTNGSLRNEQWWEKLGKLGDKVKVTFAIEGINQEMHSLYRQRTNLKKILNNAKAFLKHNKNAIAQIILFEHNEDYLDEYFEMCQKYDLKKFRIIFSGRFFAMGIKDFTFIDANFIPQNLKPNKNITVEKFFEKYGGEYNRASEIIINFEEEINCKWSAQNRIFINPDGVVSPCCYIGHVFFHPGRWEMYNKKPLYSAFNRDEHNLKNKSLEEILNSSWFNKTLIKSWKTNPDNRCKKFCSTKILKKEQQNIIINYEIK